MKKIKNILFVAMFSLIIGLQIIGSFAAELSELESGIYDIKNEVYHENELGMQMSRTYLDENMVLEKNEGKWYYTVKFKGTNYMENYRILLDGNLVETEVVSENDEEHSIELKFETTSIIPNIKAQIYVDPMGRDVEFEINPQEDTLTLVKAIEEPKQEVVEKTSTKENEKVSKTSNSTIFIVIGVAVILVIAGLVFKKSRK